MCYIFKMMDRVGSKENRSSPRINFHSKVHYQLRGKPEFDSAVTSNISCGGMRFSNDKFIPTSTAIMLEINVLNRVLRPIGRIAWSQPVSHSNRSHMGVEFIEFDTLERNYLKEFINMQL